MNTKIISWILLFRDPPQTFKWLFFLHVFYHVSANIARWVDTWKSSGPEQTFTSKDESTRYRVTSRGAFVG